MVTNHDIREIRFAEISYVRVERGIWRQHRIPVDRWWPQNKKKIRQGRFNRNRRTCRRSNSIGFDKLWLGIRRSLFPYRLSTSVSRPRPWTEIVACQKTNWDTLERLRLKIKKKALNFQRRWLIFKKFSAASVCLQPEVKKNKKSSKINQLKFKEKFESRWRNKVSNLLFKKNWPPPATFRTLNRIQNKLWKNFHQNLFSSINS